MHRPPAADVRVETLSTQPPLLEAKLRPPRMPGRLVRRDRLVERLREGRDRKLTLVCAPAGYGKTTLLGQWEAEDSVHTPFVWLSLDEGDGDPLKLWNQLVVALHMVNPQAGIASLDAIRAGAATISEVAIPLLVQELADSPPVVVILEDWHAVRNPVCDDTMRIFVDHAPDAVQVVISSRSDPGLRLPRLRAHGELAEVRAEDLRLSSSEAAELLQRAETNLEPDDVERLTSRTEGWAAGLHLASLALKDQADPRAFVDAFSGDSRHALDYLARDVLDAVPAKMHSFLIRSAVLESLSAPLCDWVLEISNSAAMLSEIEHANLFLVSVDDSRRTYRYHQLFATMLRRELEDVDPLAIATLHARASDWFERHGDVDSAIQHAIASRSLPRASDLVTKHARDYWASGRIATLSRWLEALAWPEARADPQLALVRGTVLGLTGHPAEALERWLEVASDGPRAGTLANELHSLESGIALLRSIFLTRGLEAASEAARRAIELEQPPSVWRRQALAALGQALYLLGRSSDARAPLEEARRLPDAPGQAPGAALVLAYLALIELEDGHAAAAERLARDAIALLESRHLADGTAAANPNLALGMVLQSGTNLPLAVAHFERAVELTAPLSPNYWHVHALLRLADAGHRLGERERASDILEEARAELNALPDAGVLALLLAETEDHLSGHPRREGFLGDELSESELRVLRLLAEGRSLREVAGELYLSQNTVKTHRRTIYRKLGANTREEALERAAELELVGREPPG
jgi:LuxR family maltose regulon positive regulatory protein